MLKSPKTWAGLLLVVVGVVWLLQGLGLVEGSSMTGVALWAIIGPIVALVGVGLLIMAARRSSQTFKSGVGDPRP
ncbi:MAG: hypothetical protein ACRDVD_04160 [Acidimicrobiia bacterium]